MARERSVFGRVTVADPTPWREARPGVWKRVWRGAGSEVVETKYGCQGCGLDPAVDSEFLGMPMVHDALWDAVVGGQGVMCVACFENLLGRRLRPGDLKAVPANRPWLYFLEEAFSQAAGK